MSSCIKLIPFLWNLPHQKRGQHHAEQTFARSEQQSVKLEVSGVPEAVTSTTTGALGIIHI